MSECPPESRLEQFLGADMSAVALDEIEEHLSQCAQCAARADAMLRHGGSKLSPSRSLPIHTSARAETPVGGSLSPIGAARDVPNRLGGYRILRMIGEGGMGAVYEAEQDRPRRRVALKLIKPGAVSVEARRRFDLESQMLGRLQHHGIAQVFEAGLAEEEGGPRPYFAMELIDGCPLVEFAESAALGAKARLDLVARIADAVQHAHAKGVIHRDLKPANILVDKAGQPKILDFGVARAVDAERPSDAAQTNVGQMIGTLLYMSPEQVSGRPDDLDTRSDVYSLGILLYELLTGRLPYDLSGKTLLEAVRIIREDEPSRLSSRAAAALPRSAGPRHKR